MYDICLAMPGAGIEVPAAFAPTCHHDDTHNTSFLDVNYECLCNSGQHCEFVNSIEDDAGSVSGFASDYDDAIPANGTEHARPWLTSYEGATMKVPSLCPLFCHVCTQVSSRSAHFLSLSLVLVTLYCSSGSPRLSLRSRL